MSCAVIADELGPRENFRLIAHHPGPPKPGEVQIAIKAAGISFVDVLTAAGNYKVKPPVPFTPVCYYTARYALVERARLSPAKPGLFSPRAGDWLCRNPAS